MGWLSRKLMSWGAKSQKSEIADLVQRLAGLDSSEVSMMVVAAAEWRNRLAESEGLDLLQPGAVLVQHPKLTFILSRTVQKLQGSCDFAAAAGLIIWVHSLRAMTDPLLRADGRAMWRELERGFPHVLQTTAELEAITGRSMKIEGWQAVPNGLGERR